MKYNSPNEMNAFEIKREVDRIVTALKKSSVLIDNKEFQVLDNLNDTNILFKVLKKEFLRCDESIIHVIKLLLTRYIERDILIDEFETIIKSPQYKNDIKLYAIDVISAILPNWEEQGYDKYLEYNEELMQQETQELLVSSKNDPSLQVDFMDFFLSIPENDQILLLDSLQNDQSAQDMAHVLVPIFLGAPNSEIGRLALKNLGTSKSNYAYKSLTQVYEFLDDNTKILTRKTLSELKLSGASRSIPEVQDENIEKKYLIIPADGEGNLCLFYTRTDKKNETVSLVNIIADDYYGIKACLGFHDISTFETSALLEKLTHNDLLASVSAEIFKKLLIDAEKLNYKNSTPPYEYNCWKQEFLDIVPEEIDFFTILNNQYPKVTIEPDEFTAILESEITELWTYSRNFGDETEEFFDLFDKNVKQNGIENCNLDEIINKGLQIIFYPEEKIKWVKRLIFTAYCYLLCNENDLARKIFAISQKEEAMNALFEFILKQSVYQYFLGFQSTSTYLRYKRKEIEDILAYLSTIWGFYV